MLPSQPVQAQKRDQAEYKKFFTLLMATLLIVKCRDVVWKIFEGVDAFELRRGRAETHEIRVHCLTAIAFVSSRRDSEVFWLALPKKKPVGLLDGLHTTPISRVVPFTIAAQIHRTLPFCHEHLPESQPT